MASNDPKLLYAIEGVKAYHIADGQEQSLCASGPQTLSLLMVPTSSGFADTSITGSEEEDFYLHLHLPPELDLPLPATTQIYHQPPTSYLIPRWDLGPNSGAFTKIEFPAEGTRPGLREDVDTFETILAQCTAFLERAAPPKPPRGSSKSGGQSKAREAGFEDPPPYNPASFEAGEGYAHGSRSSKMMDGGPSSGGRIVLVDEEDGSVIGELSEGLVVKDSGIYPGSKDPVQISIPTEGGDAIAVQPATQQDLYEAMHPSYKKSSIVNNAFKASRFIVTTSDYVSNAMLHRANTYTETSKPNAKPMTFTPTAHKNIRRINTISSKAVGFSAITVGSINKIAQNFGASMSLRKDGKARGYDQDGNMVESYKPGMLNKSLMAFNTVVDGMEQAGRTLLTGTTSSVSTVVGHRWGEEAGEVSKNIGGGFKNVGLVYIDVAGVSRRAILKSVAKGMVVGKVKGGGEVIVRTDESGNLVSGSVAGDGKRRQPGDTYGDGASVSGSRRDEKSPGGPYYS